MRSGERRRRGIKLQSHTFVAEKTQTYAILSERILDSERNREEARNMQREQVFSERQGNDGVFTYFPTDHYRVRED